MLFVTDSFQFKENRTGPCSTAGKLRDTGFKEAVLKKLIRKCNCKEESMGQSVEISLLGV